eukprot:g28743.t1
MISASCFETVRTPKHTKQPHLVRGMLKSLFWSGKKEEKEIQGPANEKGRIATDVAIFFLSPQFTVRRNSILLYSTLSDLFVSSCSVAGFLL